MTYNGSLENITGEIVNLSHSSETGELAAIVKDTSPINPDLLMDTEISFFNYGSLANVGQVSLPEFTTGSGVFASHGKFVFYSSSGTRYFAIVQADSASGMLHDYGISAL